MCLLFASELKVKGSCFHSKQALKENERKRQQIIFSILVLLARRHLYDCTPGQDEMC